MKFVSDKNSPFTDLKDYHDTIRNILYEKYGRKAFYTGKEVLEECIENKVSISCTVLLMAYFCRLEDFYIFNKNLKKDFKYDDSRAFAKEILNKGTLDSSIKGLTLEALMELDPFEDDELSLAEWFLDS